LPAPRTQKKPRNNEPRFELRTPLHQLAGVDLTQIDAIGPYGALRLLAEIGTDMSRWPSEKHFTSWLTLAPHNKSPAAGSSVREPSPRPIARRWSYASLP
jgi:transposase